MDAADGGDRPNRLRDLLRPKVRGGAFEDDPGGIPKEAYRARPDEDDDEQSDQRVHQDEASDRDQDCPRDDADGPERVPVRVKEGSANVDVPLGRATRSTNSRRLPRGPR